MICPRLHCEGLLVWDGEEWLCKSCSRRWTEEKLRFVVRTGQQTSNPAPPVQEAPEKSLQELLADAEEEPERDATMGRAWTEDRRRKFQATMAAKRTGGARRAQEPKKKRETPAVTTSCGGVDETAQGNGLPWPEWKAELLRDLETAKGRLLEQMEKVERAMTAVKDL